LWWQEIFGVNAHIQEVTERIAGRLCSDRSSTVSTLRPGFETGYTQKTLKLAKLQAKNQGIRAIGRYSGND